MCFLSVCNNELYIRPRILDSFNNSTLCGGVTPSSLIAALDKRDHGWASRDYNIFIKMYSKEH